MAYDLSGILTGGAASRSDSLSGLDPEFRAVIEQMMAAAPPDVANELRILSAYRSPETQATLWKNAVKKYGSESAARKWVAPPGRSQHGHGRAIDWSYASNNARDWARKNAPSFGGAFPLGNEPWHMELAGARGGGAPAPSLQGVSIASNPIVPPPATTEAAPAEAANPMIAGLEEIASGFQRKQQAAPMQMQTPQLTANAGPQQEQGGEGAAALMAQLLEDRRKQYGLSLTGMLA